MNSSAINLLNVDLGATSDSLLYATFLPLAFFNLLVAPIVYFTTKRCIKSKNKSELDEVQTTLLNKK
jgi:hypothetical protein